MNPTTPPAPSASVAGPTRLAVDAEGMPAHKYDVERAVGLHGFLWWVRGVRWPVEWRDEKTKTITLSGTPHKWRVAGPFATKAIAEKCIDPSARAP